jgi:hypothetical protein
VVPFAEFSRLYIAFPAGIYFDSWFDSLLSSRFHLALTALGWFPVLLTDSKTEVAETKSQKPPSSPLNINTVEILTAVAAAIKGSCQNAHNFLMGRKPQIQIRRLCKTKLNAIQSSKKIAKSRLPHVQKPSRGPRP